LRDEIWALDEIRPEVCRSRAVRKDDAVRIPQVAPLRALLGVVDVKVGVARSGLAPKNVVLQQEQEEVRSVRRGSGAWILRRNNNAVVVRDRDVVRGVELGVGAGEQRVLRLAYEFLDGVGVFGCALRQCKLKSFATSIHIACLCSDPGSASLIIAAPFSS
jgi:hypothetical protein